MMLFAFICLVIFMFLLALWCFLRLAFGLRNGSRQRRMERDARIFHARQKFYQDKAKWN
jgi:hypothetical protein